MWIPVITILWSLGNTAAWVNFPMINFPLSTADKCYEYIDQVRTQTMLNPDYLNGYSTCVYIGEPKGEKT